MCRQSGFNPCKSAGYGSVERRMLTMSNLNFQNFKSVARPMFPSILSDSMLWSSLTNIDGNETVLPASDNGMSVSL